MSTYVMRMLRALEDTRGQDLIEYALLAAFIALAAAASTGLVGESLATWYTTVSGTVDTLPTAP